VSVVRDLEQLETALLGQNLEGGGTSINGIFDQLLEGVDRRYNDLARGNLVHDVRVQSLAPVGTLSAFLLICKVVMLHGRNRAAYLDAWGCGIGWGGVIRFPLGASGAIDIHGVGHVAGPKKKQSTRRYTAD
jgi:hypothetical protein